MVQLAQTRRGPVRPTGYDEDTDYSDPSLYSGGSGSGSGSSSGDANSQMADIAIASPSSRMIGSLADEVGGNAESPSPSPSMSMSNTASPHYHTADSIAPINMPDYGSMHDSSRLTNLQGQVDAIQHTPSLKNRLLRAVIEAAPVVAGGLMGGSSGLSGASAGVSDAMATSYQHDRDRVGQLNKEIEDAQRGVDTEYQGRVHGAQAQAQIDSNALWRDATLNQRQAGVDARTNTQQVIAKQKSRDSLLKMGLDADGNPLPDEQLPPAMRDTILHHRAQNELTDAQAGLVKARTAGVPLQIRQAEERLNIAKQNAHTAQQRLELGQRQFEANYYGTDRGTPIPGAPQDSEGNIYGPRMANASGPTSTTRTKMQQASAIEASGKDVTDYIAAHKGEFGPVMGRVNNLEDWLGNIGPAGAELRAKITSYAALHPALHGFRGQSALKGFEEAIGGMKRNPDAMIAAINGLTGQATTAKKAWAAPYGAGAGSGSGAGRTSGGTSVKPEEWERGPDGKLRRKGAK